MEIKRRHIFLICAFLIYFALRLYFAFQTPDFNNDYSYFALRQVDSITATGKLLINDDLSYGGRTFVFMPLYLYILAFFSLFIPKIIAIKIINNLLASTIIIAVYLVCSKIIKNRKVSLLLPIVAASLPVYINETLNNISSFSIIFPGSFFLLYLFIVLENDKPVISYLLPLVLILTLTSSSIFLVLFGIIIYLVLSYLESMPVSRIKLEFSSFFMFFYLWANFIIFKSAFQVHGFSIIRNNLPASSIAQYFTNIDFQLALGSIGFLPFIFGIYAIYDYLFRKKNANVYIFISLFLSTFVLFWTKLIPAEVALMYLGASLIILFGQFLNDFLSFLKKTKFSIYENHIFVLVVLLLIITQVVPGLSIMVSSISTGPKDSDINGFKWISQNTPNGSVILATPMEGNYVTYFSKRPDVADTEYLLIENLNARLDDIKAIYTQKFKIEALRIMQKYNVSYVVYSESANRAYNITDITYIHDPCFELVYNESMEIFRINKDLCELKIL